MGSINLKHTGSGSAIALSSDGTNLLLDGTAIGGGGADLYAANESSPSAQPSATGTNSIAIGDSAISTGTNSFAGPKSRAQNSNTVALGINSNSSSYGALGNYSVAIGYQAKAANSWAISIGRDAISTNNESFAIGKSLAGGDTSFAAQIANNTSSYGASGANSIAMGDRAKASGSRGIAISGFNPQATGTSTLAFGYQALASATYASGIGYQSKATGQYSWAANTSLASGNYSTALGISDNSSSYGAQHVSSVAIGYHAVTTADKQIALGDSTAQVKISSAYTLPTSDGSANQVLTTNGSGVVAFADAGGGGGVTFKPLALLL